ncbi:MAG TPA: glycoside hydrolase family 3 [Candidatus Scatomorpha intestinigallinarum]|uniref:beta-N-acetylhexosaminidase n=1 Tax=Candidatus Scatomorpha intestinigallinarum TaxID=2840923 RepID=A0A9D1DK08_9FIRM|nr:glycoside hydrolase family 3 [Candidatus Scatomorpha intestinigallinarum]
MKKLRKSAVCLILSLLLALSACGTAPEEPALPSPDAEGVATPAPTPTPEPTPTPDPVLTRAEELLAGMSLREKLCQLMIVRPEVLTGESPVTAAGETTRLALEQYPVGGLIYSVDNLVTQEQTREMIENTQSYSKIPLIISADEEGGNVGRLMYKLGTTFIHSMYSYKDMGEDTAYQNALTIGTDMVSCLFNTDFAPVADVWTNPANTVIGDRAYSDEFGQASELVAAAVRGFTESGVICCVKHFPGHGDTSTDTHEGAAVVDKSLEELRAGEFLPFEAGIEAGVDMVMVGHITVTAVDDEPATISHEVITGLLREELGWDGVVVTDSLDMGALAGYEIGEVCVKYLEAGGDIMLGIPDLAAALTALETAVTEGRLTEQRIDESALRVLMLKLSHGIAE